MLEKILYAMDATGNLAKGHRAKTIDAMRKDGLTSNRPLMPSLWCGAKIVDTGKSVWYLGARMIIFFALLANEMDVNIMKDKLISEHEFVEDLYGCLDGFDFDLEDVLNVLNGVEPVDATPIVHGHWIEHDTDEAVCSFSECSVCGTYIHMCHKFCEYESENYCPHCGSRMDELFEKTEQLRGGEQDERT